MRCFFSCYSSDYAPPMVIRTSNLAITLQGVRDCPFTSSTYIKTRTAPSFIRHAIKRPKYREFRLFIYLRPMCHWRLKSRQNGLFCAQNKPFSTRMNAPKYRPAGRWTAAVVMPFPNGWTAVKEQIIIECGRLDIYNVDGGACRRQSLIFYLQLFPARRRPRAVGMLFLCYFYSVNNWISIK